MRLGRRITKLERACGTTACPACRWGSHTLIELHIPAPEVIGTEGIGHDDASPRPEDFCGTCGRRIVMRIPSPRARPEAWA